jgi:NADPH-dependent 2,4-dienoyl-CoA reductase/sulfur reductase-like enzyme/rhodanese-related sulfurtransferase
MSSHTTFRKVIIVGGVAGGAGVAARLRRNDENANIIILEKGPYISYANCGLPYFVGNVIPKKSDLLLQTVEGFSQRFNVDVRVQNEVTHIDTSAKTVTVTNLDTGTSYEETYDTLVLSPGASPILPRMTGTDLPHVFTLRTIPDTVRIRAYIEKHHPLTAAIIGGGFIGIEMAENLTELGIQVSVIEAMDHLIGAIDTDMSYDLHNHVRSKGVRLFLQEMADSITASSVKLASGTEVEAELVLVSIGVVPETRFIKDSGIELGPRGQIIVNKKHETSASDVYALGDAIGVTTFTGHEDTIIPLASPANKQARIVADLICGVSRAYNGSQGTAIAKVFDMSVAVTGESEKSLTRLGIPYKKAYTLSNSHATYYPGATPTFIKLLFAKDDGKILGAQITGYDMVDKRIDVIATAIRGHMTVYDLEELELSYAPPFSSAKDPVNMVAYVAENILSGRTNPFYLEDLSSLPENALLLDTRTEGEFKQGSIPGSINVPLDSLRSRLLEIPKDKDIYITCQIGLRGYLAEQILRGNGYLAHNLLGGYRHYRARETDLADQSQTKIDCTHCGKDK